MVRLGYRRPGRAGGTEARRWEAAGVLAAVLSPAVLCAPAVTEAPEGIAVGT